MPFATHLHLQMKHCPIFLRNIRNDLRLLHFEMK